MRIFCLELVSTGFFKEKIAPSFRREGEAMLRAALDDLQRIAGVNVTTVIDIARQSSWRPQINVDLTYWQPGNDLESLASELSADVDATLIIAPEFDSLLERFCHTVRSPTALSLNCDLPVLQLCGDKWRMAVHFATNDIPTIPTRRWHIAQTPPEFPCVVKPRCGAGSWLVRLVRGPTDWPAVAAEYQQAGLEVLLLQPWIAGKACSIAAMRHLTGPAEFFPVAEQFLSADGTFQYLGGRIPARIDPSSVDRIHSLAERALATLPGWSSYVGLDILIPENNPHEPLLVEINPRLTTSYIGYRQLCQANLMDRLLFSERFPRPLSWKQAPVSFTPHDDNL
jgi:predicted ATP-grasp superfamily ATP-dependent carboligase